MSLKSLNWLKVSLFILCMLPITRLASGVVNHSFADPVEAMTHLTGEWALRLLLITLCITPARRILKQPSLIKFRRMLGLFAFFYAVCHLAVYVVFDQSLDVWAIISDTLERKYIFVGMLAATLMLPLAITSTNGWIKRLGAKRWQKLHRLVYPAAIAAILHYFWLVKADYSEPIIYGFILAILLGYRIIKYSRKNLS